MDLRGKSICVLGDSITEGAGASDEWHGLVASLGRRVGAAQARNHGVSGACIAPRIGTDACVIDFCNRYAVMEDDADLVVVYGGTNDYGCGNVPFGTPDDRTPDTFRGALHALFSGLIRKYPFTRVVVLTPLQREGGTLPSAAAGRPLSDYADAIRDVAAFYALPVLDLYRMSGICPDIPEQRERFCPDGLHPSDAGVERIVDLLAGFLGAL